MTKFNISNVLKKLFLIMFIIVFAAIIVGTSFNIVGDITIYQTLGDGSVLSIPKRTTVPVISGLLSAVCFFVVFCFIYSLVCKHIASIRKYEKIYIGIFTVLMFIVYMLASWFFETNGVGEIRYVVEAAEVLAKGGPFVSKDGTDFHYYFTNFALIRNVLIYLFILAKVAFFIGFASVKPLAMCINCFMFAATIPMLYYSVKKNFGIKEAIMAVLMLSVCLPVTLFSHVVYNFVLIYPFIVFTVFIYTFLHHNKHYNKVVKVLLTVLCGLTIAVGGQLNIAAVIILIALNIQAFMYDSKKIILSIDIVFIVCYLVLSMVSSGFADKYIYNDQYKEESGMPSGAWFYTGLYEDTVGMYTAESSEFLYDYDTKEEREIVLKQIIKEDLQQKGLFGYFKHIYKKLTIDFGTGDWMTSRVFWFQSTYSLCRPSLLTEFVTMDGQYTHIYKMFTQGFHIMTMILVVIGAAVMLKNGKNFISPWVSIFGLMIACAINETNPNHAFSYVAILYMCAAVGMVYLYDYIFKKIEERKNEG